jgi:response regulator RpfG family c-di-GMP phosphodiesterase
MSDDLVFDDEDPSLPALPRAAPWYVLIVDDEPAVHEVTKLVMTGFEMDGRSLEFLHCYSAREARGVLASRDDIALILLDVVMETEHAGLDLARYVREELKNTNVRIVLRTGQPGQAPEEQVIRDYDINDYKEKTDLTRRKMITVFYAGLRAYRDLMRIENARKGLRRSLEAISRVYESRNLATFASAVLEQLNYLLNVNGEGVCASYLSSQPASTLDRKVRVLAATSAYANLLNGGVDELPPEVRAALDRVMREKMSHHGERHYAGYYLTQAGSESMIYMVFPEPISDAARELLELFSCNVAVTYDNLLMREELAQSQQASVDLLGEAVEKRLAEGGAHIARVCDIAALLADKLGMSERDTILVRQAAALHDIGKAGVPDHILAKAGALTEDEWAQVKAHTHLGQERLAKSPLPAHQLAALVAQQHHEHWDGGGYPQGLAQEQISPAARIAAVADVLDSLLRQSSYKTPWTLEDALAHLRAASGKQFDPRLIDIVFAELDAIKGLYLGHS